MYTFHANNNKTLLFERRDTVQRKETSWNLCLYLEISSSSLRGFFPCIYLDHYSTSEDLEAIDWQEESSIKLANLRFLQHAILLFKQRNKNALLYLVEHCAHPALQMQNTNMGNDTFGYPTVPTSC